MEERVLELERRIEKIEARNKRVEADKAWEVSGTRTIFIAVSTYILIFTFMVLIKDNHPFLNALIASISYLISSATYGQLKSWWLDRQKSKSVK